MDPRVAVAGSLLTTRAAGAPEPLRSPCANVVPPPAHTKVRGVAPCLITPCLVTQVTLYGFGWCDPAEARASGLAPNAVFYDPHDARGVKGFGVYHDMEAEWAWLRRLKAQRLVKRVC